MDPLQTRRKLPTYGKTNRRKIVHDLFDVGAEFQSEVKPSSTYLGTSSAQASDEQSKHSPSLRSDGSLTRTPSPSAQLDQELSYASVEHFRYTSPARSSGISSYDVPSSEDERPTVTHKRIPLVKKRKLIPEVQYTKPNTAGVKINVGRTDKLSNHGGQLGIRMLKPSSEARTKKAALQKGQRPITPGLETVLSASNTTPEDTSSSIKASIGPRGAARDARTMKQYMLEEDSVGPASGSSTRNSSQSRPQSTPKALKRPSAKTPSPSEIAINTLSLTSDLTPKGATRFLPPSPPNAGIITPGRTRQRLIDRLDVPKSPGLSRETSRVREPGAEEHSKVLDAAENVPESIQSSGEVAMGEVDQAARPSEPSQPISQVSRTKPTYGKQRSFLSDMVEEVNSYPATESQPSDTLPNSQSSQTSLPIDMFEQDDSDGPAASAGRLKSIHELRRAGASNRFDRDIELLLDDIVAATNTSRTLRIQALIALIQRVQDKSFLSHFAHSNHLRRLIDNVSSTMDFVSCVLVTLFLSLLVQAEKLSGKTLAQIFESAQHTTVAVLQDARPMSKIVADKRQNLSKSSVRDVLRLEEFVIEHHMLEDYQQDQLFPHLLGLSCSRQCLKGLLELQEPPVIQEVVYVGIFDFLKVRVEDLVDGNGTPGDLDAVQEATLLLELACLHCSGVVVHSNSSWMRILGQMLSTLMSLEINDDEKVLQAALRLVVSLSNDNEHVSRAFGLSALPEKIFSVVDDRFLGAAKIAEEGDEVDENTINTIILALVSLLNLCETDADIRHRLSATNIGSSSIVEMLVHMFNELAAQATEAVTVAQSQVLVPFGYLSMLLCALCLDDSARGIISKRVIGQGLRQLCEKAELFFRHLQTVEIISGDKSTMSQRFETILREIQHEEE